MAASHMTRSVSCGEINSSEQPDCSDVKRSKICKSTSDLVGRHFPKKAASSRVCSSSRKVMLRGSAHKLNFDEAVSDHEPPSLAHESGSKVHYLEQCVSQHSTGVYIMCSHSRMTWILYLICSFSVIAKIY